MGTFVRSSHAFTILNTQGKFYTARINLRFIIICKWKYPAFLSSLSIPPVEIAIFDRLFNQNIFELTEEKIKSSGYVLHTLEASIWCLLTTDHYKGAVLKAVNLGEDTDTTSAVTGGLAGLLYGLGEISNHWLLQISRYSDIEDLAVRFAHKLTNP